MTKQKHGQVMSAPEQTAQVHPKQLTLALIRAAQHCTLRRGIVTGISSGSRGQVTGDPWSLTRALSGFLSGFRAVEHLFCTRVPALTAAARSQGSRWGCSG